MNAGSGRSRPTAGALAALIIFIASTVSHGEHLGVDLPPVIQGQTELTIAQGSAITILFDNLVVDDPDSSYPAGFTMTLQPGPDYSVEGQTVTPAAGFSGTLSVPVFINDGVDDSNVFSLVINVNAVPAGNTAPTIAGQADLSTEEDTPITIQFSDLIVSDPDNSYPTGFTMTLSKGKDYKVDGNTITPKKKFTGTLTIPVVVNDGTDDSNEYPLLLTVTGTPTQNTPPVITGQRQLSVVEDQSITLEFADLNVTDPDNTYPANFTMVLSPGTNYSVNGRTITPTPGYAGTLSVPTVVNDGTDNSNSFDVKITVTPKPVVNTPPTITGQVALTTQEGQPIIVTLQHLTVVDPDDTYPAGFTLSTSAGANYTVSNNIITPNAGYTGNLSVPALVNDGTDNSNTFNLQIAVTATPNTAPTITGQAALSTLEQQSVTIGLHHLTVTDPDDNYPNGFTLLLSSGPNYSISDKTVTPAAGFTGTLTVPTVVNDGENNSNTFGLKITVNPKPAENVPPTIAGQAELSMLNNQTLTITLSNLVVTDPDDNYPGDFTLKVLPGDNYTVSNHTVDPAAGFVGILTVNVLVNDGDSDSAPFPLKITVSPANTNQKPVITGQQELSTFMNTPIAIKLSHLLVTDPDNQYPTGFTLAVEPGSNYTVSGTTITPASGFTGTLTAGVSVHDGSARSETFNLRVGVVDKGKLQITGQTPITGIEDSTVTLLPAHLQVNDPEKQFPSGFSIQIQPGEHYAASGSVITPSKNFSGNLSVDVTVSNGARTSNVFTVVVAISPVNDAPAFVVFDTEPVTATGFKPVNISPEVGIEDVDNETLVFAEIAIDPADFISGKEELIARPSGSIQSVFDPGTGILILFGQASVSEYQSVIQSVQYHFKSDTLPDLTTKHIHFKLNDGITSGAIRTKIVSLEEIVSLDIPNVFTPNGDEANDTWTITNSQSDNVVATVRVFNKRGMIVYESNALSPWDGRYKGEIVPPDTYYYVVEVDAGFRRISKKGALLVVW